LLRKLSPVPARTPTAAVAVAAVATVLAVASAWHSGGRLWSLLDAQHSRYATLSASEREALPFDQAGLPGAVFAFYASLIGPGDRVYFQVGPPSHGARLDLATSFAAAARFALLPAVQTTSLAEATVVVSYRADPGRLHVPFLTQQKDGSLPAYVSRISSP